MMDLRQGDCLEVMKSIPDKSIDAIICDLPYGTTACKWDSVIPFEPLWEQYKRIIKDNGAIVLTAQSPFDKVLGASNLPMLRYEWIWEKEQGSGFANSKKMPLKLHENVLVFYNKLPTYNPQGLIPFINHRKPEKTSGGEALGKNGLNGKPFTQEFTNFPKSIIKFARDKKTRFHPTQKPVALMEYLVKTYTNQGDTVLDNCMGSGTTGVACKNLGRKFIGIEQDANYFEIAKQRIG